MVSSINTGGCMKMLTATRGREYFNGLMLPSKDQNVGIKLNFRHSYLCHRSLIGLSYVFFHISYKKGKLFPTIKCHYAFMPFLDSNQDQDNN